MAVTEIQNYLKLLPNLKQLPDGVVWLSYDEGADTLYVNYKKPSQAIDSEITEDDVIIRYEGDDVVGFIVLHASKS